MVEPLEIVIPLDRADLELLQPVAQPWVTCEETMVMDVYYPLPTLLVKVDDHVIAEIDGPANIESFLEMFQQQKAKAVRKQVSPQVQTRHDTLLYKLMFYRTPSEQDQIRSELSRLQVESLEGGAPSTIQAEMVRDEEVIKVAQIAPDLDNTTSAILKKIGLQEKYIELFEKASVTPSFLRSMDDATLGELGVDSAFERKRILAWIEEQHAQ
jgi:hypothetical protein